MKKPAIIIIDQDTDTTIEVSIDPFPGRVDGDLIKPPYRIRTLDELDKLCEEDSDESQLL